MTENEIREKIDSMQSDLEKKFDQCRRSLEVLKPEGGHWEYDEAEADLRGFYETAKDAIRFVAILARSL